MNTQLNSSLTEALYSVYTALLKGRQALETFKTYRIWTSRLSLWPGLPLVGGRERGRRAVARPWEAAPAVDRLLDRAASSSEREKSFSQPRA